MALSDDQKQWADSHIGVATTLSGAIDSYTENDDGTVTFHVSFGATPPPSVEQAAASQEAAQAAQEAAQAHAQELAAEAAQQAEEQQKALIRSVLAEVLPDALEQASVAKPMVAEAARP